MASVAQTDKPALIPFSSRLREGRALAQDVWSIFKCVANTSFTSISNVVYSVANLPSDCLNLGQGYMNFAPVPWIREAAEAALKEVSSNHYSHPKGRINLRNALKKFYSPQLNRELDVETEILVTSGANEGVCSRCPARQDRLMNNAPGRNVLCLHRISGTRRRSDHV